MLNDRFTRRPIHVNAHTSRWKQPPLHTEFTVEFHSRSQFYLSVDVSRSEKVLEHRIEIRFNREVLRKGADFVIRRRFFIVERKQIFKYLRNGEIVVKFD